MLTNVDMAYKYEKLGHGNNTTVGSYLVGFMIQWILDAI